MRDVDWLKANQTQTEFSGELSEKSYKYIWHHNGEGESEKYGTIGASIFTTVAVLSHKQCMSQFKISFMSVNICLW